MRRNTISALAAFIVLVGLTGIGTASANARPRYANAFPIAVRTPDGTIHLAARPTRILCLTASSTQTLYAIGAGSQVIGVDKYSMYPANAPRTSFTGYETDAEDYVPLHPDLVILAFPTGTIVQQLKTLNIPTLVMPPASTIAEAESQVEELGQATGHIEAARATVASINADLRHTVAKVGNRGKGATYYVEIHPDYYTATSTTFIGSVFSRFKMVDIANAVQRASAGYPQLNAEYLLKANPDYVFLTDTICCKQSAASFAARPGFSQLRAVRLGHVIGVNDSVAQQWGPHSLEEFVAVIAQALLHSHAS